ncbi:hypothetical protein, partial [Prevotellamassilia timonensis]|uniref:hypothetical protein n=1 Tax=Prevotellamassilia timonensis TaxID=1852370 RepID=UPI00307EF378
CNAHKIRQIRHLRGAKARRVSERIRAIGAIRECYSNILLSGKTPKHKQPVTDNVVAVIFRDSLLC